jgi:hypothetical protein
MAKPTQTDRLDKAAPKPLDDPLAQLIDQHSDEVEPIATTSEPSDVESPEPQAGGTSPTA